MRSTYQVSKYEINSVPSDCVLAIVVKNITASGEANHDEKLCLLWLMGIFFPTEWRSGDMRHSHSLSAGLIDFYILYSREQKHVSISDTPMLLIEINSISSMGCQK